MVSVPQLFVLLAIAGLPRVHVLATGGTIAGQSHGDGSYTAGQLSVDALLAAVPELAGSADVTGEQVVNIASQDMNDQVWLALRERVVAALADSGVAGVVITHGTDTMEETALFLHHTVVGDAPVVLTGAMRPATDPGADGPANLLHAVRVAADPGAQGRGCLVVLADTILSADDVTKSHTTHLATFRSPNIGPVGVVVKGAPHFLRPAASRHVFPMDGRASLPHVAVVYAHAGVDGALVDAAVSQGARGIVLAGTGNGNGSRAVLAALDRAQSRGVLVVRSTRTGSGFVARNVEVDDDARGFVAAGFYNPGRARVLLSLILTETSEPAGVQKAFFTP